MSRGFLACNTRPKAGTSSCPKPSTPVTTVPQRVNTGAQLIIIQLGSCQKKERIGHGAKAGGIALRTQQG